MQVMRELLQRMLSVLTHQHVDITVMDVTLGTQSPSPLMRRTTNSTIMSATQLPGLMRYFAILLDEIKEKLHPKKQEAQTKQESNSKKKHHNKEKKHKQK